MLASECALIWHKRVGYSMIRPEGLKRGAMLGTEDDMAQTENKLEVQEHKSQCSPYPPDESQYKQSLCRYT